MVPTKSLHLPCIIMRHQLLKCLVLLGCFSLGASLRAQPGSLDMTFNTYDDGTYGNGPNSSVAAIALQPDGKIILGGSFISYNGWLRNRIVRLNENGTMDATFDPGTGANNSIGAMALQPDGKILICGDFATYNGISRNRLARLNADGSLDSTFDPGVGTDGGIFCLRLQPDGKVIVGGEFLHFNNTPRRGIVRLNTDGSLDSTFDPGEGATDNESFGAVGQVFCLALQSDGKIIAGGRFDHMAGVSRDKLARLNTDGSIDTLYGYSWQWPSYGKSFNAMDLQSDGKLLLGGNFTEYNGMQRNCLVLLNSDGTVDTTFDPGNSIAGVAVPGFPTTVLALGHQADGKFFIGGSFLTFGGTSRVCVVQLNMNGSLDSTFVPGSGAILKVGAICLLPDGKILLGGWSEMVDGAFRGNLYRLNADGALDDAFNPGAGTNSWIFSTVMQPDGKVLIGGYFSTFNWAARSHLARLNTDGSLDYTFDPGVPATFDSMATVVPDVERIALQSDGKVLVTGWFDHFNGLPRMQLVRLASDGSVDTTFNFGSGPVLPGGENSVVVQPDGKILVGGCFTSFSGYARSGVVRLNENGSMDDTFDSSVGADGCVESIALQPDGKILVAGNFTSYNGTSRNGIARLNDDGSLDPSFDPGTGDDNSIGIVVVQPDSKILIGGWFTHYNGSAANHIARLNVDGLLDPTFQPGNGPSHPPSAISLQPDGKILVGGTFAYWGFVSRMGIARLNIDGSLDALFDPGTGTMGADVDFYDGVFSMAQQSDGKIIIGGRFTNYNGTPRNNIARLNNDFSTSIAPRSESAALAYPNPSADVFTITSTEVAPLDLVVSDPTGRIVMREHLRDAAHDVRVDLGGRPAGVYAVQLRSATSTRNCRLVKQ